MTPARLLLAGAFATCTLFQPAQGQVTSELSSAAVNALQNALTRGEIATASEWMRERCGALYEQSRDPASKVTERARTAREALECANAAAAQLLVIAAVTPSITAFQVAQLRELVSADVQPFALNAQVALSEQEFLGLKWGVGIGVSMRSTPLISDAEIVNGVVRVKDEVRDQPRAILESHKYFWCNRSGRIGTRGCGPFLAVVAKEDKLVSGVGVGLMFGKKVSETETEGFSIGVGAILDADVKDLGPGFEANAAPPAGETTVRIETKSRWSLLVFATRTF